jgi:hypothetical protein
MRPVGMSLISQRRAPWTVIGPSGITKDEHTDLDMVKEDLMQLTISMPYTREEDIPIRMRHHIVGGGGRFTRLLCKFA